MIGMIGLVIGACCAFGGFYTGHYILGGAGVILTLLSARVVDDMIDYRK